MDHEGQLEALRAAVDDQTGVSLTVTDCLALCSASNVIVVRHGRERQFFGRAASDEATAAFADWIDDGLGPDAPDAVRPWVIDPAREFEQGD